MVGGHVAHRFYPAPTSAYAFAGTYKHVNAPPWVRALVRYARCAQKPCRSRSGVDARAGAAAGPSGCRILRGGPPMELRLGPRQGRAAWRRVVQLELREKGVRPLGTSSNSGRITAIRTPARPFAAACARRLSARARSSSARASTRMQLASAHAEQRRARKLRAVNARDGGARTCCRHFASFIPHRVASSHPFVDPRAPLRVSERALSRGMLGGRQRPAAREFVLEARPRGR